MWNEVKRNYKSSREMPQLLFRSVKVKTNPEIGGWIQSIKLAKQANF